MMAAQMPWLPIGTAPKDGTEILLCRSADDGHSETFVQVASWRYGGWTVFYDALPLHFEPTHWMPLPRVP